MVCLHCGSDTQVINSRPQKRSNSVWRRRKCLNCQAIFTTEEVAQYSTTWAVTSSAGRVEPFSRDKLFLSLYASCAHRPTAIVDAAGLADTVIRKLGAHVHTGNVSRAIIKQTTQVTLNRFDTAASTHYAAFHKSL